MSETSKSRLPVWLIVSIVVNALLIGVLIGGGLGQRKAGPRPVMPGGGEDALVRGIDHVVPEDQRQTVRRAFRRAFADSRAERLRVRDVRQALARDLSAETYDAAVVRQRFAELRDADAAMRARMHEVLTEQFGMLTPEQRRAIISDISRREARRGQRRPGPGRGERPPPRD